MTMGSLSEALDTIFGMTTETTTTNPNRSSHSAAVL